MRLVKFHPEAEAELIAAAGFYDNRKPGLGLEFIAEVQRSARVIAVHPKLGRQFSRRLRRVLIQRFPYALLYRIDPAAIFILAVAHLHRRPGYWRERS